jgi:hypothetical protein
MRPLSLPQMTMNCQILRFSLLCIHCLINRVGLLACLRTFTVFQIYMRICSLYEQSIKVKDILLQNTNIASTHRIFFKNTNCAVINHSMSDKLHHKTQSRSADAIKHTYMRDLISYLCRRALIFVMFGIVLNQTLEYCLTLNLITTAEYLWTKQLHSKKPRLSLLYRLLS